MKKIVSIVMLSICVLSLNSCFLFIPYAIDQEASYSENLDYSVVNVSQAVLDTLANRPNVTITKNIVTSERSVIEGKVNSRKYKGTFSVNVTRIADNSATLSVKYNIFGDKIRSRDFLKAVKDNLKQNYSS